MRVYEPKSSKWACYELIFANKIKTYRPLESSSLSMFFKDLAISLSKAILWFENILAMGDFNINVKRWSPGYGQFDEFCDQFSFTNLIKSETCKPLTNAQKQMSHCHFA